MAANVLRINTYRDGLSGHTNVTLIRTDGETYGEVWTYGAHPGTGIIDEAQSSTDRIARNPGSYSYKDITLTDQEYNSVRAAIIVNQETTFGSWAPWCNNCVDFVGKVLENIGMSRFDVQHYLEPGSLIHFYAQNMMGLCSPGLRSDSMLKISEDFRNYFVQVMGREPTDAGDLVDIYNQHFGPLLGNSGDAAQIGVFLNSAIPVVTDSSVSVPTVVEGGGIILEPSVVYYTPPPVVYELPVLYIPIFNQYDPYSAGQSYFNNFSPPVVQQPSITVDQVITTPSVDPFFGGGGDTAQTFALQPDGSYDVQPLDGGDSVGTFAVFQNQFFNGFSNE